MRILLRTLLGIVAVLALLIIFLAVRARSQRQDEAVYHKDLPKNLRLETSRMSIDSTMAQECTCKGSEQSPDLYWRPMKTGEMPDPNVKSYALIVTDPDAPSPALRLFDFTHWVLYDIPVSFSNLPLGLSAAQAAMHSAQFGKNSMGDQKYIGPCPPVGKHVYVFKIYALDTRLVPPSPLERVQLLDAMKGHILGYGELKMYYAAQ